MGFAVGGIRINPIVILAPMAGITDLPFRRCVARYGAGLLVSEMVLSHEILGGRMNARSRAEIDDRIPTSVQIAGREPAPMAEVARFAQNIGAPIIDINMGCPAKKVTGGLSGAALMRDLDHAMRLIAATVEAVDVPVTLKMRLGWDDSALNAPELARRAEDGGIQMIAVHGRTRAQFYKGSADWAAIRAVREATTLPLIANGDVVDAKSAREALRLSGADAVTVGRGAQGRPWLLAQMGSELAGEASPVAPALAERSDLMTSHYEGMLDFYGVDIGRRVARKHMGWYLDGIAEDLPEAGAAARLLKTRLMREDVPANVLAAIDREVSWLDQVPTSEAAA